MKGPGPPAQSSPSYRTEQTLPVTPHLGTTPQTLGASRPPGPSAYMLCLRSASAYRLRCYAEAQLAGQHALLKPLDNPVELSPAQVKINAGVQKCRARCRAQVKAALQSSGPRNKRKLLGGATLGQACGRGRRTLLAACFSLPSSTSSPPPHPNASRRSFARSSGVEPGG